MIYLFIPLSSVLYALSFPKFDFSPLIFFFLIPVLYIIDKKSKSLNNKKIFFIFFFFAFFSNIIIIYWIPEVMVKYGGTSDFLGILALIALSSFLSIFTGIAGILIKKNLTKESAPLLIASIWIAKDLFLEYIFNGFPWCFAGYSQYKNLYFIQISEIGGIYLISFIIILINVLLFLYVKNKKRKYLIYTIAVFIIFYASGFLLLQTNARKTAKLNFHKAGIIQPNSKNELFSRRSFNSFEKPPIVILQELFSNSKALYEKGAEFIIWPEYTLSIYPLQSRRYFEKFSEFTTRYAPILAGFTDYKDGEHIYNSAILFKGDNYEKYDKVHLVPFGEYILFKDILFFIKKITDQIGEFTAGEKIVNLSLKNHKISTPICYEIIFPKLVRDFVNTGGELLVTISNDSWYGVSAAPYQLLSMAVFRSIENRRYNLRVTSNGISALISPAGKIMKRIGLNEEKSVIADFKYIQRKTFYTKYGFTFPYIISLLVILHFFIAFIRRGKSLSNPI